MPTTETKTEAPKTTTVKEEKTTTQTPSGQTVKSESKTTVTTAPTGDTKELDKKANDERIKKVMNAASFGSSVGFVTGLGYAFAKKKGFWGYVGYSLLGSLMFGTVAGLGTQVMTKPKAKK